MKDFKFGRVIGEREPIREYPSHPIPEIPYGHIVDVSPVIYDPVTFERKRYVIYWNANGEIVTDMIDENHLVWDRDDILEMLQGRV